jgi:undecaprenyl-diphosphatase
LRRGEAARFSFLMSVPITTAAALLSFGKTMEKGMGSYQALLFAPGCIFSGIVGNFPYNSSWVIWSIIACGSSLYRFGLVAVVAALLILL